MSSRNTNPDFLAERVTQLFDVPTSRLAIALCLDVSWSMNGKPIEELNRGIEYFLSTLREHPSTRHCTEVGMFSFADSVEVVLDFQGLAGVKSTPSLHSKYEQTNMGDGVNLALDRLEQRVGEYRSTGVDFYKPWLVVMSDGMPTTDTHIAASQRARELEGGNQLKVLTIGIGGDADTDALASFSNRNPVMCLHDLKFAELFDMLSRSAIKTSQSRPSEDVKMEMPLTHDWFSFVPRK